MSDVAQTETPIPAGRIAAGLAWLRANGAKAALEVVFNFALPYLIYTLAHGRLGDVGALMAASLAPLGWTVVEFVRARRIDALSLLVLAGIALSLIAFVGGGGVRFLQLREQLATGVIGLVFLGSAAIGRPLVHQLAKARVRRRSDLDLRQLQDLMGSPIFRRTMMVMTLAWGVALVAESATASALVFALSIPQFLVVSPILGYGTVGAMSAWSFWYARRRLTAARAALAAGSSATV